MLTELRKIKNIIDDVDREMAYHEVKVMQYAGKLERIEKEMNEKQLGHHYAQENGYYNFRAKYERHHNKFLGLKAAREIIDKHNMDHMVSREIKSAEIRYSHAQKFGV